MTLSYPPKQIQEHRGKNMVLMHQRTYLALDYKFLIQTTEQEKKKMSSKG